MQIIIVGGGTAGWIAALTIARAQPEVHQVTLIQSKKIGIIGAGEGSTGILRDFLSNTWFNTGIDIEKFAQKCHVTQKIGIKHVNWTGDGSWYFAPLDGSSTAGKVPDVEFCQALVNHPNKFHVASRLGQGFERRIAYPEAFHFDAYKFSEYLAEIAISSGVNLVETEIVDVITDADRQQINQVITAEGDSLEADLFIDCSGFSRILAQALDIGWVSYRKNLPVDAAIAFQLPLDSQNEPLTTATAMDAGWMWKIPTTERYGCGYVYASDFISKQKAHAEIEAYYGREIEVLRDFRFESGRSQVLWKNNCLILGLAAAFAEPLEATAIHSTIMQTIIFALEYLNESKLVTFNQERIAFYNQHIIKMYDDFRDFLVVHYLGGRTDTPFWRYISDGNTLTPKAKYIVELAKHTVPSALTFEHYYGCAGSPLYNWVLAGLKLLTPETARRRLQKLSRV